MNESQFWAMIEDAWATAGGWQDERQELANARLPEDLVADLLDALDDFIPALRNRLRMLDQERLLAFDRILERKLYDIDRAEIQEITDGSDDGFLYARGFIVAAGQDVYEAVNAEPARAPQDVECEEMCYLSWHIYEEKFGTVPRSEISRETASNTEGWPDL